MAHKSGKGSICEEEWNLLCHWLWPQLLSKRLDVSSRHQGNDFLLRSVHVSMLPRIKICPINLKLITSNSHVKNVSLIQNTVSENLLVLQVGCLRATPVKDDIKRVQQDLSSIKLSHHTTCFLFHLSQLQPSICLAAVKKSLQTQITMIC